MKFDRIIQAPCLVDPELSNPCPQPITDERCNDPAFAAANPAICRYAPLLKIRPDNITVCEQQDVKFETYLYANGIEYLLDGGLEYSVSDRSVLSIAAATGVATGVAAGIVTVSVKWQNYSDSAQATVMAGVDCCAGQSVGMFIVIDNSRSMNGNFDGKYGSKLAYAKRLAASFVGTINATKDQVALESFNTAPTTLELFTDDTDAVKDSVNAIPSSNELTSFFSALENAIYYLNVGDFYKRVLVLISDGEERPWPNYYIGPGPVPGQKSPSVEDAGLTRQFKDEGGIIICVGVRASGYGFEFLERAASSGFFLNAYPATGDETFDYLSKLKGYFCAGHCAPPGDVYASVPQLNWSDFVNWDVEGKVDLIGEGTGGTKLFDMLPGHGMYVDLCGTVGAGRLTSKVSFTLLVGKNYKLSMYLAGNQRDQRPDTVLVKLGSLVNDSVSFEGHPDYIKPFALYEWTVAGDGGSHKIIIEQGPIGLGWDAAGNLIDLVKLENLTDDTILLLDTFDNENQIYVPPDCGVGYDPVGGGYAYGYDCYSEGCLEGPIPQQRPDPVVTEDLETDTPVPVRYTSTKEYTAECESPLVGESVTRSATATSYISQDDAETKAYDEAVRLALADLRCVKPNSGGAITINDVTAATPYPSVVTVSGLTGKVQKVTVELIGLQHTYPLDVDILLIGPTGRNCLLMSDCGGGFGGTFNLTIDDGAPSEMPESGTLVSGRSYKPTNHGEGFDPFDPPAPDGPFGSSLSVFDGTEPNGDWYLYVFDDHSLDVGTIASWKLNIISA